MGVRPRCNVLLVLPGTENIYSYYHHACCRKLHFLSNGRRELILGQSVEKKTSNSLIDHSTMQRKLRPFLGVWQATRKDDAAKCKSTLDLLPEDLSLSCFGEGKLTQRSKRQGYCFCVCVWCRFPGFFSAMSNTATWPRARKLARPFQALSAKHLGALLYRGTRLAET